MKSTKKLQLGKLGNGIKMLQTYSMRVNKMNPDGLKKVGSDSRLELERNFLVCRNVNEEGIVMETHQIPKSNVLAMKCSFIYLIM